MKNSKSKQRNAKKKKSTLGLWLVGGVILALVFTFLVLVQMTDEKSTNISGLPAGTPAPEFTLDSTEGEISLADYKGKNAILYFYEGNT